MFLSQKYKEAKQGAAERAEAFAKLHESADLDMVKRWEAQERLAQGSQAMDPSTLDIYDVQLHKGQYPVLCWIQTAMLINTLGSTDSEGSRAGLVADLNLSSWDEAPDRICHLDCLQYYSRGNADSAGNGCMENGMASHRESDPGHRLSSGSAATLD